MENWSKRKNVIDNGDLALLCAIFLVIGLVWGYFQFYHIATSNINIFKATQKDKLDRCVTELKGVTTTLKTVEFGIEILDDEFNLTDMLISHNISLESKQKYLDKFSSLEKTLSDIEERYK